VGGRGGVVLALLLRLFRRLFSAGHKAPSPELLCAMTVRYYLRLSYDLLAVQIHSYWNQFPLLYWETSSLRTLYTEPMYLIVLCLEFITKYNRNMEKNLPAPNICTWLFHNWSSTRRVGRCRSWLRFELLAAWLAGRFCICSWLCVVQPCVSSGDAVGLGEWICIYFISVLYPWLVYSCS
jgi:hypothetical protein